MAQGGEHFFSLYSKGILTQKAGIAMGFVGTILRSKE